MKKFEIIEHPSELKFIIYGNRKEDIFINAAYAMQKFLKSSKLYYKNKNSINIEIKSIDLNSLLVDFLSDILANCQIEKAIYTKIKFLTFSDNFLKAKLEGYDVRGFDEDIKAVTYQDLDIKKEKVDSKELFTTNLVFDI